MGINSISGANSQIYAVGQRNSAVDKYNKSEKSVDKAKTNQKADSLTLSEEAQKFAPIKKRIAEGFYNSNEVLENVAQKLDKDIQNEVKLDKSL
jgi:isocitrate lyase